MRPTDAVRAFLMREQIHDVSVTAALSGGADSVCLLDCLIKWQKPFRLQISAVHVQHNLRGAESQRDEDFCRTLCEAWKIPLHVISVDVKAYAEQHHLSIETAARECRYQAFETVTRGFVATAHTASDNLETVLFRLARGTGLKGLCGIPPKRDSYLRPLLETSRAEIESYLHEKNLSYLTDSTNLTDEYQRNFIRHQIVPRLAEIQSGGAEKSVTVMTEILRQEENFLEQTAQTAYQSAKQLDGSFRNLHTLHPALRRRCIVLLLEEQQIPVTYHTVTEIQKLLEHGGTAEIVRGTVTAHVSQNALYLQKSRQAFPECPLRIGKNQIFPGYLLEAVLIDRKNSEKSERIYKLSANSALDYDIIKKNLILHDRKPGLHLKPAGRAHTVSVKKWLQTLPLSRRQTVHYLSDDEGLLWVQGLGVCERAAVTEQTKTVLILHVHEINTEST